VTAPKIQLPPGRVVAPSEWAVDEVEFRPLNLPVAASFSKFEEFMFAAQPEDPIGDAVRDEIEAEKKR